MRLFKPTYKGRDGKPKKSAKWYVDARDHRGERLRLPGFADKQATHRLGHRVEDLVALRQRGAPLSKDLAAWVENLPDAIRDKLIGADLIDRSSLAYAEPLAKHVEDYRAALEARGRCDEYCSRSFTRITAAFAGCGFVNVTDLNAERLNNWLAERRKQGLGATTSNHYATAAKLFTRWLVKAGKISADPLATVGKINAKVDIRRKRRAVPVEQLNRLIATTAEQPAHRGLSGPDRAMLYLTAAYTGLRASELASLTERSFDFDAATPTVTVAAAYSKHKSEDTLPLHPELVSRLRGWFAEREAASPPTLRIDAADAPPSPLWPGQWASDRQAAKLLRRDLNAAGVPYHDETGRVFDFHALRHQTGSMLAAAGVHPKTAQQLMRHSDINLTMGLYTHVELRDTAAALGKLPTLGADPTRNVATGTDGAEVSCHRLATNDASSLSPLRSTSTRKRRNDGDEATRTVNENTGKRGFSSVFEGSASPDGSRDISGARVSRWHLGRRGH